MAVLLTPPILQFFDEDGNPLSGGKIYSYAAGTTNRKATYTDESGATQNTNPVILDAAGRAVIFIQGSYRFDIKDANDVLIRSIDNVTSFATLSGSNEPVFDVFSGTGTQTTFTLSKDLGTDPKSIQVFISTPVQSYIDNGDFASDAVWTKGTGWTIGAGVATATGAISTAISQTATKTVVAGKAYRVTYTITRSAGGLIPSVGGNSGTERTASGTYNEIIIAGSTQTVAFTGNAFTGTLDNVTIENVDTVGFQIQDPSTYTLSGTTLAMATAPASGTRNIYVLAPTYLVGAAVAAADQAIAAAQQAQAAVITVENQKLVWRGDWAAGTYVQNDAVQYGGSSWIVSSASTTDTPSLASPNWDLLAEKGADGTGGVTSPVSANIGGLLRASAVGTYGWFAGSQTVSSASTVDITASTSPVVLISGTTTITSLGTPTNSGDIRYVVFTGSLTLTHNATSLILPGATNITTNANDVAIFVSRGGNGWRCASYSKYDGRPIVGPTASQITDATVTGQSLITAADAAAVRTVAGVYDQIVNYASVVSETTDITTTKIPRDNTVPQNTEGKEYFTVSITPKANTNKIVGVVSINLGAGTNNTIVAASVFRDSGANAIAVASIRIADSADVGCLTIVFEDSPATTSATTYKVRFGPGTAANAYVNQNLAGALYGGVMKSSVTLFEIRV